MMLVPPLRAPRARWLFVGESGNPLAGVLSVAMLGKVRSFGHVAVLAARGGRLLTRGDVACSFPEAP